MKHEQLKFTTGFRVSVGNKKSQGAVMVLAAGANEGGPDNRHHGADQWLMIIKGTGAAKSPDREKQYQLRNEDGDRVVGCHGVFTGKRG